MRASGSKLMNTGILEPKWVSHNLCDCLECDCVFKIQCPHIYCKVNADIEEGESYGR